MSNLEDLKDETLDPELGSYLQELSFGLALRHPLVFGVPYHSPYNSLYNQQLKHKKEKLKEAKNNKNWESYVFLHERPFRLRAFVDIMDRAGEQYSSLLCSVWTDAECPGINRNVWRNLFSSPNFNKEIAGGDDIEKDPKSIIKIYRGTQRKERSPGLSWTLDKQRAIWFSKRFGGKAYLYEAEVLVSDIKYYTDCRGEKEVVTLKPRKRKLIPPSES